MIGYVVAGYLAIGCLVLLAGPGRREIAREVRQLRGSPIANAITGRAEVPRWKVVAFAVIMSLGAVLLWPILVSHLVQQRAEQKRSQREWEKRVAQGLEFSRMGGMGEIHCGDCGFAQEVTSFMHGFTSGPDASCDEGFQCLACGKFTSVHREGNPAVTPVPRCECGGELSRDHFLFCPTCRSTHLSYGMSVIS